MKQHVRAEDFSIFDDRMVVGGRVFEGNSILFAHVEKRVSLELLGFYLVCICLGAVFVGVNGSVQATIGVIILFLLMGLGAYRELARPYVLVMNLYQAGIFEVRGFTKNEAAVAEYAIDQLRGSALDRQPGRQANSIPGSSR